MVNKTWNCLQFVSLHYCLEKILKKKMMKHCMFNLESPKNCKTRKLWWTIYLSVLTVKILATLWCDTFEQKSHRGTKVKDFLNNEEKLKGSIVWQKLVQRQIAENAIGNDHLSKRKVLTAVLFHNQWSYNEYLLEDGLSACTIPQKDQNKSKTQI